MRHPEFLRERYRAILGYTGLAAVVAGLLILFPLALLALYPAEIEAAPGFLGPGLALALPGLVLWRRLIPRPTATLTRQEGSVVVLLAWLLAILAGAVPFMIVSGLSFHQAVFECTSGWTTTGLSVLDVSRAPRLILFYRSLTQLAGGAGWAIIMLTALAGPPGPGISLAEGREDQLLPHVRRSARLVLTMYLGYILAGVVALYAAGMDGFDAVNHALTAVSTGSFSTRAESIAYWNSPAIEAVIVVLMLLGATNFLTAHALLRREFRSAAHNGEALQMTVMVVLSAALLLIGVTRGLYPTLEQSSRVAIFHAVSALSTTGFGTVDLRAWNGLGILILIVLMLVGGGTGSTAGAIKQYRVHVLYRALAWDLKRWLLPRSAITEPDVWKGAERTFVTDIQVRSIATFVFLYLVVFLAGSGLLASYGYPLANSLFEFSSALGTAGLSVGIVRPDAPAGVLWIETAAMFLGRLEFLAVFVGLVRLGGDLPIVLRSLFRRQPAAR